MRFRVYAYLLCTFVYIGTVQAQEIEKEQDKKSFLQQLFSFFHKSESSSVEQIKQRPSMSWQWERSVHSDSKIGLLSGPVVLLPSTRPLSPGGTGGGVDLDEEAEESKEKDVLKKTPEDIYAELRADTSWLVRYKEVCHSASINPYTKKWEDFDDTLHLELYNPLRTLEWSAPLAEMVITSDFGTRRYRWHYGVDARLERGDSVQSAFYGVVRLASYQRRGFGHYVVVHHYNGLETIYGHLSKRLVRPGDIVRAGDAIGLGGSTGRSSAPHLHFELRYEGLPVNPNEIFDFEANTIRSKNYTISPTQFTYLKRAKSIRFHRVRRGQTLSHISQYYGVSIRRLCRLNRISRKSIIRVGQRIRIR